MSPISSLVLVPLLTGFVRSIGMVGKMMSVREEVAYPLLRQHDVDYILVMFGGLIGYSGDDLNKFLWMVRISEGIWPEEVNEQKFFTSRGEYKVDADASETMKNSLMYKMSYYRFVFPPPLFLFGAVTDGEWVDSRSCMEEDQRKIE